MFFPPPSLTITKRYFVYFSFPDEPLDIEIAFKQDEIKKAVSKAQIIQNIQMVLIRKLFNLNLILVSPSHRQQQKNKLPRSEI